MGRGDSRDGSWARTHPENLQCSFNVEDRYLRKSGEGDGFIVDSVFNAIMQISSTMIPKYIEPGLGITQKRDYLSFDILAFSRNVGAIK